MQNLQSLETGTLIDMLIRTTSEYRKMLDKECREEEFVTCESNISKLQSAINSRLINSFNASAANANKPNYRTITPARTSVSPASA